MRFEVIDDDGASASADREVAVAARPPVNDTTPAVTGVLRVGGTVTGVPGDWSGTGPITYSYAWERCDAAGCTPIPGATSPDHVVTAEDAGYELRIVVTADNFAPGTVAASSPRTAVVAPALTAPRIATGPPASTSDTSAAFALEGEPGAELWCSLDGAEWTLCAASHTRADLALGEHVLRVRQTLDGLTSPEATRRWTVVSAPVITGIVGKVPTADGTARARRGAVRTLCGLTVTAMRSCAVVATATVTAGGKRKTITVGRGRTGAANAGVERRLRVVLTPAARRLLSRAGHLDAKFAFTGIGANGEVLRVTRSARISIRLLVTVRRYFGINRPELTANTKAFLARLAARYPYATRIRCVGHADGTARNRHGLWLGRQRARNACRFLAGQGLKVDRRVITRGTHRPEASNRTAAGRARNRVVVVTLSN